MRVMSSGLVYFAMVFAAGFAMGILRVLVLVPRLGDRLSELLEMPLMLVVIVLSARFVVRRFDVSCSITTRLVIGFFALALLVGAELFLVTILQDQSLVQYIASRDPVSGSVYAVMLVLFALMPLILTRTHW